MTKLYKGFRIRIFPTKEQIELFWKHIGACRFIWNYMLDLQRRVRDEGGKHLSVFSMIYQLKPLKNDGEHDWLYDVSNTSLQRTCRDLEKAYQGFFSKTSNFPKFRSKKRSPSSYPVCCEKFYFCDERYLMIQKVGRVKYKTDIEIPIGIHVSKFCDVRVSYDGDKWFVSFEMEYENQVPELTDKVMGIDLGIKELAMVAVDGKQIVYHNINKSKKMKDLANKKKHIQRSIARKYEQNKTGNKYNKTNNIIKEENELRKVQRRINGIKNNYIHQTTHELVSILPKRVVMEGLNVSGMMKNKHLARAVQEQCFYEFRRQMQYKCEWNGIEFILADRFYPSSKMCSCCGNIKKDLKLSDRTYKCPECGLVIDRDFNAALNLSRYEA